MGTGWRRPYPAQRRARVRQNDTPDAAILQAMTSKKTRPGQGTASGMKSAYELALERLDSQGIERPREDALSARDRELMAEIRQQAKAKLAEVEILHRDRLAGMGDPDARRQEEEDYQLERRRIEAERDRKLAKLRDP
jgi:hypothetical protein